MIKTRKELDEYCKNYIMDDCNGCDFKSDPSGCFWVASRLFPENKILQAITKLKEANMEGKPIDIMESLANAVIQTLEILERK
jgi:hypothetical protein